MNGWETVAATLGFVVVCVIIGYVPVMFVVGYNLRKKFERPVDYSELAMLTDDELYHGFITDQIETPKYLAEVDRRWKKRTHVPLR